MALVLAVTLAAGADLRIGAPATRVGDLAGAEPFTLGGGDHLGGVNLADRRDDEALPGSDRRPGLHAIDPAGTDQLIGGKFWDLRMDMRASCHPATSRCSKWKRFTWNS